MSTTATLTDATRTTTTDKTAARAKLAASRAFRIGGRANLVIAAGHVIGLIWAWSLFRSVGIEHEMRELAMQGAALPYILTLLTAAGFAAFGLYGLSGAGDVRRLPVLQAGLIAIAAIFILRGTLVGGIGAVYEGDGAQIAFAAIALLVGLCYAYGVVAQRGTGARAGHIAR